MDYLDEGCGDNAAGGLGTDDGRRRRPLLATTRSQQLQRLGPGNLW